MTEQVISRDDKVCLSNQGGSTLMTEQVISHTSPFMIDHIFLFNHLQHDISLHVYALNLFQHIFQNTMRDRNGMTVSCMCLYNLCHSSGTSSGCLDTVRLCLGMAVVFVSYVCR